MVIRLVDVAKESGVSRVLAGKILLGGKNENIRFSAETAARVKLAANKLGYSPNQTARQLRGIRSKTIGVVMPIIESNILFSKLRKFVCNASENGYSVLVREMPENDEGLLEVFKDFSSRQLEGLLSFECLPPTFTKSAAFVKSSGMRAIFYVDAQGTGSTFHVHLANGIEQAVDHLVKQKYKNIALFLHKRDEISMRKRLIGFKSGLKKNNIEFNEKFVWSADIHENIPDDDAIFAHKCRIGAQALITERGADAMIMSNDIWALHMSKCVAKMGISIPNQLGLVGFDNTSASFLCSPELTTIDQGIDNLMIELMSFFLKLDDTNIIRDLTVKPHLIVRESTLRK